jgi:hypothetical protein
LKGQSFSSASSASELFTQEDFSEDNATLSIGNQNEIRNQKNDPMFVNLHLNESADENKPNPRLMKNIIGSAFEGNWTLASTSSNVFAAQIWRDI